jgi:hypothetical protein
MALTIADLLSVFPNPVWNYTGKQGVPFPNYNNYTRQVQKPVRRTDFDANVFSVRPKIGAFPKRTYNMTWEKLEENELNILETHFSEYYASRFVFYPPELLLASNPATWTEQQFEDNAIFVVYADDTLKATMSGFNRWKVNVELIEARSNPLLGD